MDYSDIPIVDPPAGVTSNFIDPVSNASVYLTTSAVFLALMLVLVVMRMWVKLVVLQAPSLDDGCCLIAVAGQCTIFAVVVDLIRHGLGKHSWDVPISLWTIKEKFHEILDASCMVVFIAKLSLLLLYFRLFSVARGLRYSIFFGIGFMALFYTILMFLFIFLDQSKFLSLSYAVGSVNIVTDLYILILPMVPVSRMQLSKKKKVGVQCIFLTASLACIASVLGMVYRVQQGYNEDTLWMLIPVLTTSSVELSVGIICSCFPFMPALFRKSGHPASLPFFDPIRSLLSGWGLLRSSNSGDTGDVSRRAPPSTCHSHPHDLTQDSAMEMGQIHAGHSGKFANRLDNSSKTNATSQSSESDY